MSRYFACRGRLRNLGADCSTTGFDCVLITWKQIFKGSLQVTVVGILPHVIVERRQLWQVMQRDVSAGSSKPRNFIRCERKYEWKRSIAANEEHFYDCFRNMENSFCGAVRVKRFVNVHLHCIVSNLKRISKMLTLEKFLRTLRLPDVVERQGLSLNLLSKLVISLILKTLLSLSIFRRPWKFLNSCETVHYWTNHYIEHSRIKIKQCNWTE